MVADLPGMRAQFERVGEGAVLNNSPTTSRRRSSVCEEAGAVVTDAYGAPLAPVRCSVRGPNFRSHASPPRTESFMRRSAPLSRRESNVWGDAFRLTDATPTETGFGLAPGSRSRGQNAWRLHAPLRPRVDRADSRAGGTAGGAPGLHISGRLRRRGLGDPLHAGAADAQRRARHALAGDPGPGGVLQRDQGPPQRLQGTRRRSPTSNGSSSTASTSSMGGRSTRTGT